MMTNVDSQRIREIRDNTKAMAEAFSSIANTLADALELYISTRTETQNSNLTFKTLEYCDICDHKGCKECIANALDEHCIPSQFKKQIEDECAKEYEELGLKELKELIKADRKTENSSEKPNNCKPQTDCKECKYAWWNGEAKRYECSIEKCPYNEQTEPQSLEQFRVSLEYHTDTTHFGKTKGESLTTNKIEDEPQTDEHCETCRHKDECEGATYEYKNTEWWCLAYAPIEEPQTDCAWK